MPKHTRPNHHPSPIRPWHWGLAAGVIVVAGATRLLTGVNAAPAPADSADRAREPLASHSASPFPTESASPAPASPSAANTNPSSAAPSVEASRSNDPHAGVRKRVADAVAGCMVNSWNDEGIRNVGGEEVRVLVFDANMTLKTENAGVDEGSKDVSGLKPAFVPTEIGKDGIPTGHTFQNKVRSGGGNQAVVEILLPANTTDGRRVAFGTEVSATSRHSDGTFVTTTTFVPCEGDSAVEFDTSADPDRWVPLQDVDLEPYSRETIG